MLLGAVFLTSKFKIMIIDYNKIIEKHLGVNTPQWIKDNVYSCIKEIEEQNKKECSYISDGRFTSGNCLYCGKSKYTHGLSVGSCYCS